jgi:predicted PurR-regulated permease PerM
VGRGLIVGAGGTALAQGALATITYVALGIPRALVLGPLTAVCAVIPVIGTGLVWIPLAVELALARDYVRAGVMAAVGAGVLSLIDNLLRPILTRYGRLALPVPIVLVAILGGIEVLGAAGALLGPLLVRLAVEALRMARAAQQLPPHAEPRSEAEP